MQKKFRLDYYSIIGHTIGTSVYNPLAESSYIKLPKDLDHPRKILINIQCIYDNECFKLCLIRYLNPSDCKQVRITRADKDLTKKLDFKYMTFLFIQ